MVMKNDDGISGSVSQKVESIETTIRKHGRAARFRACVRFRGPTKTGEGFGGAFAIDSFEDDQELR
jgi:hypothetical protein